MNNARSEGLGIRQFFASCFWGHGETPPGYPLQVRPHTKPTRFRLSATIPCPCLPTRSEQSFAPSSLKPFRLVACILFAIPGLAFAQDPVKSGVYPWPTASSRINSTQVMLTGTATDLSYFEVTANMLAPGKQQKTKVPATQEHLLLVNAETITLLLNDSTYTLAKGSVALVMPGEKYSIKNNGNNAVNYHVMKYRSRLPIDLGRGKSSGGSFVKDWNKLKFKPHERGGVRPYFDRPTAMAKRFEMHTTTLNEGNISHPPHTHAAEEIILILEGQVEMLIGEISYKAKQGDVLFAPSKMPHGLKNIGQGQCSYFAFQWE